MSLRTSLNLQATKKPFVAAPTTYRKVFSGGPPPLVARALDHLFAALRGSAVGRNDNYDDYTHGGL